MVLNQENDLVISEDCVYQSINFDVRNHLEFYMLLEYHLRVSIVSIRYNKFIGMKVVLFEIFPDSDLTPSIVENIDGYFHWSVF